MAEPVIKIRLLPAQLEGLEGNANCPATKRIRNRSVFYCKPQHKASVYQKYVYIVLPTALRHEWGGHRTKLYRKLYQGMDGAEIGQSCIASHRKA